MALEQNMDLNTAKLKKVLLIEDDPLTVEMIRLCLEVHRPDVSLSIVNSGLSGIDLVRNEPFMAVLLDLGLTDIDGMIVLEEIRRFSPVPILIVSARSSREVISAGLEAGADDYLTKPFNYRLLLSRIDRLIQPISPGVVISSLGILDLPGLTIDLGNSEVKLDGKDIQLNAEECTLLASLALCEGKLITLDKLSRVIWNKDNVDLEQMESTVSGLRQKLGDSINQPKIIISEHGSAYRLFLPLKAVR